MNVDDIANPVGGMSQTLDLTLFGIHSTKYDEFFLQTLDLPLMEVENDTGYLFFQKNIWMLCPP